MTVLQQALLFVVILLGVALMGVVLYCLTPVLLPFLIAATLAYLMDPLVEYLNRRWRVKRTLAAISVFLLGSLLISAIILIVIPTLQHQTILLIAKMPIALEWLQNRLLPQLVALGLVPADIGLESLKAVVLSHLPQTTQLAKWMGQTLFHSSLALLNWIMNLIIVVIATFYFLRDWPKVLLAIKKLLPARIAPTCVRLAQECDSILATFVRGQLSVMGCLTVFYTLGLALIGVNFSLLLGVVVGLLSIVPYLGSALGLAIALVVAYMQFQAWLPIVGVLVLFGIGHILEGIILTPLLIGDKLGLHPLLVIFAVLAGGQLLGFAGVVLAIPIAAILVGILREGLGFYASTPSAAEAPRV